MQSMTMQVAPRDGSEFLVHLGGAWIEARYRDTGALEIRGRGLMKEGEPGFPVSWKPSPGIGVGVAQR